MIVLQKFDNLLIRHRRREHQYSCDQHPEHRPSDQGPYQRDIHRSPAVVSGQNFAQSVRCYLLIIGCRTGWYVGSFQLSPQLQRQPEERYRESEERQAAPAGHGFVSRTEES